MNSSKKRILKDLQRMMRDKSLEDFKIKLVGDPTEVRTLKFSIGGPPDTPYESGTFVIKLRMPSTYPFKPPEAFFDTHVWHPNISSVTGYVCLNTLKEKWRPVMDLRVVLITLQELLREPNGDSPQDIIAGAQFNQNPQIFKTTAIMWTNIFAKGENTVTDCRTKLDQLESMGLGTSDTNRLRQLSNNDWDLTATIERLLSANDDHPPIDEDGLPYLNLGPNFDHNYILIVGNVLPMPRGGRISRGGRGGRRGRPRKVQVMTRPQYEEADPDDPEEYECLICHEAEPFPNRTISCGHRFHRACLNQVNIKNYCPACQAPVERF